MWLLDLFRRPVARNGLLHVGAQHLRCYAQEGGQWALQQTVQLEANPVAQWPALERALRQMKEERGDALGHAPRLLLDSHWAPVCWVPAGKQPFSPKSFLALARHRFGRIHGPAAQAWHIQSPYLVGDASALAFALPDRLQHNLLQCLGPDAVLEPTLGFMHDRWSKDEGSFARAQAGNIAHLCLLEDERMLVLTWQGCELLGCHPALDIPAGPEALADALAIERRRLEIDTVQSSSDSAVIAHIQSLRPRLGWPVASQKLNGQDWTILWQLGVPGPGGLQ